jgi:hypothetical protein
MYSDVGRINYASVVRMHCESLETNLDERFIRNFDGRSLGEDSTWQPEKMVINHKVRRILGRWVIKERGSCCWLRILFCGGRWY